jgi:nucleoside-diphosphate-sugar epimerase
MVAFVSWFTIAYSNVTRKAVLLNRDKILEMKQAAWVCSGARARTELGFSPKMNLQTGMQQTGAWYRQQGWLK